ncbi:hypothetical protein GXW74_19895 [Roseomonas eburnea]|uniref:Uncharacterized protein n=1 Tax=Neoroseomonas eburnea TaxID=1346889 RepID=A0A9X9XGC9_9PROT|nr:hypothetical protein [Neoroseomonas eburnea]MBR0682765.1 hypothetical protein [Neoroseomonas eburnea]
MKAAVWEYPHRHSTLQRLRTSEAQRQRHRRLDPLTLINMQPIAGTRYATCRWILQTGRPPLFCAAPVAAPGCAWCADHARIVFVQPPD